ncbi:MAG: hypothetical protein K2X55_20645 [Burkholderiaceae bacterium]|nr:hypothetical protein [Burkholderiaceae bacterium]
MFDAIGIFSFNRLVLAAHYDMFFDRHKKNDIDIIFIDIDIIWVFNGQTFANDTSESVWTAALQTLPGWRNVQETTRHIPTRKQSKQ